MNNIKTICVCGAGTMGSGIAQVAAMAGFDTIQFDVSHDMLEKSRSAITKNLEWYVSNGKINAARQLACLERIRFTGHIRDCIADLCIEAITEQKEAKAALFSQLSVINTSTSIFATNTSSISVTELAATVQHPSRVVGLHFFNPAPIMKLVEVVKAAQTDTAIVETMVMLTKALGKIPVVCNDAPGFIVNRVARQYYLEAMKLVESGLATIETIDAVMETTGFKMGPFRLMDLIGIDINLAVSNIVWEALGKPARLIPSPIQKAKMESGELGRKKGKGFYVYGV
ncbi:MAG: 3-hydroxyacyl-CoA dehydrogenase NAD-binding domain-containing protein [Chitinophagaceae bacterium]|nr:3-hydroxyacyl-CoA dehydrogenase NAD-binding domain-containing protein [Chitinophagaceae bacterium]